jgi:hypothetical protein
MSEWWTYSLSDFLLFSPRTYYRLFELYNLAIWPLQVIALASGAAMLPLFRSTRPWHGRVVAAILALCWLWVAWAYFLERYDTINWAARYAALGFAAQALLLLWRGGLTGLSLVAAPTIVGRAGLLVVLFALLAQPFVAPLFGRPWAQAEIFGIAPDPTAIATLGIVVASTRLRWELMVIPALWCGLSAATLWTMGSADAFVPAVAATVALLLALRRGIRPA